LLALGIPSSHASATPAPLLQTNADVQSVSSSGIPTAARGALTLAERSGREVQTIAFTPSNEFVVVAANRPLASPGFPAAIRDELESSVRSGRQIDVVAFSRTNQWLIVAEDWLRHGSVPDAATQRIRILQRQGARITSFAFSHTDVNGWVLTAGGRAYTGGRLPAGLTDAITAAAAAQRDIHEIAISPTGQWVLVAESWFASRGLPTDLRQSLERMRTDDRRRIDLVAFNRVGTTVGCSVVSNRAEPLRTSRISLIENWLSSANSTIYQRMKALKVTGLSIAVVDGNRIMRRSYGLRQAGQPESYVYPNTIFEAASISKPVSAV